MGKAGKIVVSLLLAGSLLCACGSTARAEPTASALPAAVTVSAVPAAETAAEPETAPVTEPETEPVTEPEAERFVLTFAGDCTLGCHPRNYYAPVGFVQTVGQDYSYPFRNVMEWFGTDDFTMVNLEGALCGEDCYPVEKKHNFRGPTDYVNILTENSVEAVTLANNHTMDFGQRGYDQTVQTLQEAELPYVERDGTALVTTERGLTIGLYGMVYYRLDLEDMAEDIEQLEAQGADVIVVAAHWGVEGTYQPTQAQIQAGRAAIDAGADIVFGTHPHVLQPVESYNGGVIFYSLGNFSFGGNTCPDDFDTALARQEVIRGADGTVELGKLTLVPACVSSISGRNDYQPTPYAPDSPEYDRVLAKLAGTWEN